MDPGLYYTPVSAQNHGSRPSSGSSRSSKSSRSSRSSGSSNNTAQEKHNEEKHNQGDPNPYAPLSAKPLCVVLDMDGTMIGRISPSVCEYEILKSLEPAKLKVFKKQLVSRLKYGPVRPHLAAFCRRCAVDGIDIFVYTASEDQWAHFIIPCIEQSMGIRFQRPFFTRSHCHHIISPHTGLAEDYRKSIDRIIRPIHGKLKRKHHLLSVQELSQRTFLIDNNPNVLHLPQERSRLIKCPTYNYMYVYDVLSNLSIETLHAMFHRAATIMKRHGMLPATSDATHQTYQEFMQTHYAHLALLLRQSYAQNFQGLKHDRFWLTVWDKLLQARQV